MKNGCFPNTTKMLVSVFSKLLVFSLLVNGIVAATYFKTYPKTNYETSSSVYGLKIDGATVDVVKYYGKYSYAHFAYEGTATFAVTLKSGASIVSFDISPHSYELNAKASVSGSTLTFSLPQVDSRYLVVKISTSSGAQELLVIAADPQETGAPVVGGNVKDITAAPYNADKTGTNLQNTIIQNAINDRSAAGGGVVYFPAGVYKISNNISLKSNVTLYLEAGAVLRGSSNRNDYTWNPTTGGAEPNQGPTNFIIVGAVSNAAIKGRGLIDANSTILVGGSGDGFGTYRKGIISSALSDSARPNGIVLQDITLKDATTWTVNIQDALNVTVRNVKMLNDYDFVHSDGFDICSTDTALVDNCLGVTGDDVFDAKGTSTNPVTNVTYSNSVAYSHKGCGTKVGVQARGVASNIRFTNIDAIECYRGMSVSHDSGVAAYNGIYFEDVRTEKIVGSSNSGEFRVAPFVFWTLGGGAGPVTGVSVVRCYVENCGGFMGIVQGYDSSSRVSDVSFEGLQLDGQAISSSNYTSKVSVGPNVVNLTFSTGGSYALINQHSGFALDNGNTTSANGNGNPVNQWTPNGTTAQKWTISAIGGNKYKVVSAKSGMALDNSNTATRGAGMIQWTENGTAPQQWRIGGAANGCVKLTNVQSSQVLDDNNSTTSGTQVVQWTDNAGPQQQWKLVKQ